MKIKTSELTGAALDWAVAWCEGKNPSMFIFWQTGKLAAEHNYSTDWSQGGPISERERIELNTAPKGNWSANGSVEGGMEYGPTPLIAAMRCFVASRLGDEVEIPEELAQ